MMLNAVIAAGGCLALALLGAGCSTGNAPAEPAAASASNVSRPAQIERLAIAMAGSYSSAEQAKANPEFRHIVLHMKRIWRSRDDGPWLYIEQAVAEAADKPYRQRVYRLVALGDGRVRSDVYTLPGDALRFAGEWKRANPLPDVDPTQLVLRDGCSLILTETSEGAFVGSTNGRDCPSELRGAAYATSEARITATGMVSWDRGYNAAGAQVWGAVTEGYRFRKALPW